MSCGECNVIPLDFLYCSVNGSVCLVCCLCDKVCELFSEPICKIFLGVVVMEVLNMDGSALLDRLCIVFQRMCRLCL